MGPCESLREKGECMYRMNKGQLRTGRRALSAKAKIRWCRDWCRHGQIAIHTGPEMNFMSTTILKGVVVMRNWTFLENIWYIVVSLEQLNSKVSHNDINLPWYDTRANRVRISDLGMNNMTTEVRKLRSFWNDYKHHASTQNIARTSKHFAER